MACDREGLTVTKILMFESERGEASSLFAA